LAVLTKGKAVAAIAQEEGRLPISQ
jgi:hypothetical protein